MSSKTRKKATVVWILLWPSSEWSCVKQKRLKVWRQPQDCEVVVQTHCWCIYLLKEPTVERWPNRYYINECWDKLAISITGTGWSKHSMGTETRAGTCIRSGTKALAWKKGKPNARYYPGTNLDKVHELFGRLFRAWKNVRFTRLD